MKNMSAKNIVKDSVVLCEKRTGKSYVSIWVSGNPEICAKAKNLALAEEQLVNKIWGVCELDEPFAIKYIDDDSTTSAINNPLFWAGVNDVIDTSNPDQYFNNGFCKTCQMGAGGRNKQLLSLDGVPRGVKSGLIVRFEARGGMQMGMDIIHSDICKMINEVCRPLVEFRQVLDKKRGPTDFLEIIPVKKFFEVSPIGKKDPGGKCAECGSVCLYNDVDKVHVRKSDADFIRQHGVAAIGDFASKFCISGRVWESIKKLEAARRLLKHCPMIELTNKDIDPNPKFSKILPPKPKPN